MHALVPIIIIAIILIQVYFFVNNRERMRQFSKIFSGNKTSWTILRNDSGMVNGITGEGNQTFQSIVLSINKYLGNNTGSVIDFGLLKDAVDRHCDSVENDISTQTPIPLYWGLAGTMAGVILGLWDLIGSGAIQALMGSASTISNEALDSASGGISALLSGVAWAMLASICGILLTTGNSLMFKKCKLLEEDGKNAFLAWMQSELLPKLPGDTSKALTNMVVNLNRFNNTFKQNTAELGEALRRVNESYDIQAQIVTAVHDMDLMAMAQANSLVLDHLQQCTDKLEDFQEYLDSVKGYTDQIHQFEEMFRSETNRLGVLEEIRDFFRNHRAAMSQTVAQVDAALKQSLTAISNSTQQNITQLNKHFVEQSEHFKKIISEERDTFERLNKELKADFSAQLQAFPQLMRHLEQIADVPARLDKLADKLQRQNANLSHEIGLAVAQALSNNENGILGSTSTPMWMKITGLSAAVIIALTCLFGLGVYIVNNIF